MLYFRHSPLGRVSPQLLLFLLCGGMAALINMGGRWLLNNYIPYEIAIILAFFMGMTTAFLMFKFLVFHAQGSNRTMRETWRFVLINTVALVQTLIISVGLADYLFMWIGFTWHARDIAHIIGVIVPIFTSFLGHKHFTFTKD